MFITFAHRPLMTLVHKIPWSRHWRWVALIVAVLVMIIATGRRAEQREIDLKATALRQAVEMNSLGLRGIIARHDYLPYAVSKHPDITALLKNPENAILVKKVNGDLASLQRASGSSAIFLIDIGGTTLAASNWDEPGTFVGQSYRRRPYFEDALEGRRGVFYGLGLTTGISGLFIAEPVRSNDRIIGVLVVKIGLDSLESTWAKSVDPVVLQDSRGIVFLSSEKEWMYRSVNPLGSDDLEWLSRHGQYGERQRYELLPWERHSLGDAHEFRLKVLLGLREREFLALSTTIPELGWTLTVTSDYTGIQEARREAQAIVALLSALLVMGILYWRLREKRHQEQQRAKTEREQREKERQLQRSARLASVGEMASTLAHELNQPLMALSNFAVATRAMIGSASPEMLVSALNEIIEQSKRASEIVRRVRAFINPQRASYENLEINVVILQAISMLQAELQRSPVYMTKTFSPNLAPIRGDKVLLEQVVVNLIQNAIHAQLDQSPQERSIEIETTSHQSTIEISVADNGPGIPEDQLENLFTPFFSTKTEGLGLGLNICRTIVEAHGGEITLRNRKRNGAVFTITLPVAQ